MILKRIYFYLFEFKNEFTRFFMNSYAKREWFTAFELEGIGDLPNKATNITRKATKENWKKQQVKGNCI